MTKRPKLSLSSSQERVKKRPTRFEVAPPPSAESTVAPRHQRSEKQTRSPPSSTPTPARASTRANTERPTSQTAPPRFSAGTISKALLIVGVAALSILLLRRRLL